MTVLASPACSRSRKSEAVNPTHTIFEQLERSKLAAAQSQKPLVKMFGCAARAGAAPRAQSLQELLCLWIGRRRQHPWSRFVPSLDKALRHVVRGGSAG